jgi:hypothetical protein
MGIGLFKTGFFLKKSDLLKPEAGWLDTFFSLHNRVFA